MASTNIDRVFEQIKKDFVEISKAAARNAATKAQKDIKEKADRFIDEYYDYDPVWYHNRKKSLYKLVEKVYYEVPSQDGITITFGVRYNPSNIDGIHKSYSPRHKSGNKWISRERDKGQFKFDSGDNGIPEAEWITEKFIEGIHPSGKLGDEDGIRDLKSPDEKMQDFFDTELNNLVSSYMNKYLLSYIKTYF